MNKCVLLINVNYDKFQVLNVLIFTTFTIILYIWYVSFCCFQIVAVLLMASVFATLEMRLQMSWRTRFMKLIVLAFIISIPMTWFELYKVKNQHLPLWYISNFVSNSNLTCALYTHRHYYSLKLWCHLLTLYHCYMAGILLIKPIQSINTDVMQHFIFHLIWVQFLKERFFPLSKKKINKYRDFIYLITGKFNIIPKLHQVLLDFLSTYCVFN